VPASIVSHDGATRTAIRSSFTSCAPTGSYIGAAQPPMSVVQTVHPICASRQSELRRPSHRGAPRRGASTRSFREQGELHSSECATARWVRDSDVSVDPIGRCCPRVTEDVRGRSARLAPALTAGSAQRPAAPGIHAVITRNPCPCLPVLAGTQRDAVGPLTSTIQAEGIPVSGVSTPRVSPTCLATRRASARLPGGRYAADHEQSSE
jgi:hypothetical protein